MRPDSDQPAIGTLAIAALMLAVWVAAVTATYIGLTIGPDSLALTIATLPPGLLAWFLLRARLLWWQAILAAAMTAAVAVALVIWSAHSYST